MSKHTKEPWSVNDWPQNGTDIAIGAIGTPLIAKVQLRDVSVDEQKANARRIVACVNACEGFSIEELEHADLRKDSNKVQAEIIDLKKHRDELLVELKATESRLHEVSVFCATIEQQHNQLLGALIGLLCEAEVFARVVPAYGESQNIKNARAAVAKAREEL